MPRPDQLTPFPAAGSSPPTVSSRARWEGLTPLAREIVLVLIVKAGVLYLLWFAFFRVPAAPQMTMDPQEVEQKILAPGPASEPPHALR